MPTRREDFTAYCPGSDYAELCERLGTEINDDEPLLRRTKAHSRDGLLPMNPRIDRSEVRGIWRVLACQCFGGQHVSLTGRMTKTPLDGRPFWPGKPLRSVRPTISAPLVSDGEIWNVARPLCREIPFGNDLAGLIVVAGRTGSGKSTYARCLVKWCLDGLRKRQKQRPPHVVTFEDPLELQLVTSPKEAQRRGFDYTARQKGVDVVTLEDAVTDALRQTPAIFFAGETRDSNDWQHLLRLAATGHLVITTTHAGSLIEAMDNILRAISAVTPSHRSQVASKVAALIHIRQHDSFFVPSLWRNTPTSIAALTSEGLGSMVPQRVGIVGHKHNGTVGRTSFVEKVYPTKRALLNQALQWDLRGE